MKKRERNRKGVEVGKKRKAKALSLSFFLSSGSGSNQLSGNCRERREIKQQQQILHIFKPFFFLSSFIFFYMEDN